MTGRNPLLYFYLLTYPCFSRRMCVCVCVCKCVLLVCENVCSKVAKIVKNDIYGIEHFQSNCAGWVFFPWTWKSFSRSIMWAFCLICEFLETDRVNVTIGIKQLGSHILTIDQHHCECCTSWPWPTFSMTHNLVISETMVRGSEKCSITMFVDFDIRHRNGSLRILYFVTLTYIIKVKHFKRQYLGNCEKNRKNTYYYVYWRFDVNIRHRMSPLTMCCAQWPLTYFNGQPHHACCPWHGQIHFLNLPSSCK